MQIIRKDGSVIATIDFENEYVGITDPLNVIPITFDELEIVGNAVFAGIMAKYGEKQEKEWKKIEEDFEGIGIIKFKR